MKHLTFHALIAVVTFILLSSVSYRHDKPIEIYLKKAQESQFEAAVQLYREISHEELEQIYKMGYPEKAAHHALKHAENAPSELRASCSAVIINEQYILTAAHCFFREARKDTIVYSGDVKLQTHVITGHQLRDAEQFSVQFKNRYYPIDAFWIHPAYNPDPSLGSENRVLDIAIIKIDGILPDPPEVVLNSVPNELHSEAWMVGFGKSGPANRMDLTSSYNLKMAAQTIIDSIPTNTDSLNTYTMLAELRAPTELEQCNQYFSRDVLPLEGGTLGGDSGSGLFREQNGTWELIGIGRGAHGGLRIDDMDMLKTCGYYGTLNSWLRVSQVYNWIIETIE